MGIENFSRHGFSEAYVIVRTVELVKAEHTYRIEVLESPSGGGDRYSVRYYRAENVELQPTFPATERGPTDKPRTMRVWADFEATWVHEDDAERALGQAMTWLAERTGGG